MLQRMQDLPKGILGFEAIGTVTGEDYEKVLIPAIEEALEEEGSINFLYYVGERFESYDLKALYDDAKFGLSHYFDFKKIAVVTDVPWIENMIKMFTFVFPAEIKIFKNSALTEAKIWLEELATPHLEVTMDEAAGIAILEPTQALEVEDFKYARSVIDNYLAKHEKLNGLVIKTKKFPGWDSLSSLKAHFDFIKEHHKNVEKLAFVTDSSFIDLAKNIGELLVHPQIKEFTYDDFDDAIAWIKGEK